MSSRIAIFGAGLSGQAAMKLAQARGYEVALFDEAGQGSEATLDSSRLSEFERFVFSPGFAAGHPWRVLAEQSGGRVQSELGFAAEHWQGRLIGVTGTNGKTTLTRLLAEALQRAGQNAVAAGNIGCPLSDVVLQHDGVEPACAVCEISSFQAELVKGLKLDDLLWTNFAEDHLDRYATMADYFLAKANLFDCLKTGGICVIGPQVVPWLEFYNRPYERAVVSPDLSALVSRLPATAALRRPPYNGNFSLAAEYWRLSNLPEAALLEAAGDFTLAPHRLSVVTQKDGVTYWNDSKSTNFHSALAAFEAVDEPIIWIGGGQLKGGDLEAFASKVSQQVELAVLYGESAQPLAKALEGKLLKVRKVDLFEEAVRVASESAYELRPSSVLLSPAFSSFDQFQSYEMRGKTFISLVLGL